MNKEILTIVSRIIKMLVEGNYENVVSLTNGITMTVQDMQRTIDQYGRTLIAPPDNAYDVIDIVQVKDAVPSQYSVWMPLWTEEEGRSDLTLQLRIKIARDHVDVSLDGIRVL